MAEFSKRENRVYVGNLSYDVKDEDLKAFFEDNAEGQSLEVAYAEVLITPNGLSKGCGIVEFTSPESAQIAIESYSDRDLLGRPVFVREDREQEARFGANPTPSRTQQFTRGAYGAGPAQVAAPGTQLFIGNLPFQVGWQDLKDLFRQAGHVVRADVQFFPDGKSKGNGIVSFSSREDAQNAIELYHNYEFYGRPIEVREDKFANSPRPARTPYQAARRAPAGPGPVPAAAAPNPQIVTKNLPYSTTNEDLVDLFETTGDVKTAEILMDVRTQRSRGVGLVEFYSTAAASVAIEKFNGYIYGGRSLEIGFSARPHNFSPTAAIKVKAE